MGYRIVVSDINGEYTIYPRTKKAFLEKFNTLVTESLKINNSVKIYAYERLSDSRNHRGKTIASFKIN